MGINIRFSNEIDIVALLNEPVQKLHKNLYSEYFKDYSFEETKNQLEQQLKDENRKCCIAAYDGVDVGYALFFKRDYKENPFRKSYKGIHIDQISVLEGYKHKGIGKAIMKAIFNYAKNNGATQIELLHWEKNEEAKTFYEKQGFETQMRFVVKKI
jgi:GNAT superfamily N-acetyltransferase